MIPWLAAVCVFVTLSALYLGGFAIRIQGGGALTQTLGWLLSGVLYLVVFRLLLMVLQGALPLPAAVAVSIAVAAALLPALCWVAFRPLGVRISRGPAAVH